MIEDYDKFESEWMKMLDGEVYEASHHLFHEKLMATRIAIREFNELRPDETMRMEEILRGLFGRCGKTIYVNQPFRCDYGCNIFVGDKFFANFNLTILDEATVTIGNNVFIGPNVSIYTACHPLDPDERRDGREWAESVTIGNDVWIGGGTTILPGVKIGDGVTIGAGSVVTRDIPARSVAVGNPARVVKKLD